MPRTKKKEEKIEAKPEVKKRFISKKIVIITISVLLIALAFILIYLGFEYGVLTNPLELINKKTKFYSVKDECSLILGNLIHSIKDEGICQAKCKTYCETRELNYQNSEFILKENDCNLCNCYCK